VNVDAFYTELTPATRMVSFLAKLNNLLNNYGHT